MDSHAVSYTTPSRRNSSRTYQDLAAYHTNGYLSTVCPSYIMEETIKVSLLLSYLLHLCLHSDRQESWYLKDPSPCRDASQHANTNSIVLCVLLRLPMLVLLGQAFLVYDAQIYYSR